MVYDETPLCSPRSDEFLENFTRNIFGTRPSEDDYCEHEDGPNQEHDLIDENSPFIYQDGHDDYWMDLERPIFDTSRVGSVDHETWENLGMEEEYSKFSHDHSKSSCKATQMYQ